MTETQKNYVCLHRKEWQTMMPAPTITAAGGFVIHDNSNQAKHSMYIISATVHYLYDHNQDDWTPIASGAFGTAIAAGACGCFSDWSSTYTATGGTTTTITVNAASFNINQFAVGKTVEFLSGTAANLGLRKTISSVSTPAMATGTITLTFTDATPSVVANNDTFRLTSGTFYAIMPGTLVASSFRKYDLATGVWASCTNTGLPATWGTDGRMVTPCIVGLSYDTGTATSGGATTLTDSGKAWVADQLINYMVRITGGTGIGQRRTITDNTATVLTVAAWATQPDATSTYSIEGDENAIYLLGNGAVTLYKYSISGNSWATVAPTTARAAVTAAGMSADFVGQTGDATWALVTALRDGRYIYSLRGGTAVLDRFDISGGTNGAGAWEVVAYHPYLQTFATGDSTDWCGKYLYIAKEGSGTVPQRFYRYDIPGNVMEAITTDWYFNGVALLGNKMWMHYLSSEKQILWLYNLGSTSTNLRRIMVY